MSSVGATLGVEEEYHLLDARTGLLREAPEVVLAAAEEVGETVQGEISTSQLEVATPVLGSLADVRREVGALRRRVLAVAERSGVTLLSSGTHPLATWREQSLSQDERYQQLHDRWALLALQQLIAGCHVHVGVDDADLAVAVLAHLRPDLPTLVALSASSPYWEGVDTGYASYRTMWFGRFPVAGLPEPFADRADYDRTIAALVRAGVARDASHLYWDVRPSVRFPTVEVRVADAMPLLDDVVLHAGLVRALVQQAAADVQAGRPAPVVRAELGRAAKWRAARWGLEGELLDLRDGELVPAPQAVRELLRRLGEVLEASGEGEEVVGLAEAALARGTSAARQRAVLAQRGDLAEVALATGRETAGRD